MPRLPEVLILTGALLFTFITPANAQTQYVQEIKTLETQRALTPLFQKVMALEPFKRLPDPMAQVEINETLNWLRQRGFFDNESARYTYAYAAWLWNAGIKDVASAMYFNAEIKMRSDGARCVDKTSVGDRVSQYEQLLQEPIAQFLKTQSKATKEKIFKLSTMRLEERLSLRQPDEWLCNGGIAFFKKYIEKHGNLSGTEVTKTKQSPARTLIVEDDSIQPDFIDSASWQTERKKATDSAVDRLSKLLLLDAPPN